MPSTILKLPLVGVCGDLEQCPILGLFSVANKEFVLVLVVEKLMAAGSSKILSVMSAEGKTVVVTLKGHQKHLAMT